MKLFTNIYNWCIKSILRLIYSVQNFIKSSILSLVVILVISLLLTEMEQALTMVIDLIESDGYSLILSYFFINALAVSLSHYPVYTYYATNLNQSQQYIDWREERLFRSGPLKWVRIYVYDFKGNGNYKADFIVNFLRYGIGILVFIVWTNILITSFESNLKFDDFPVFTTRLISYASIIIPYIIYSRYKIRIYNKEGNLTLLYKRMAVAFFIAFILSFVAVFSIVWLQPFSKAGLVLLLFTNFLMVCNYLLFRLLRSKMSVVKTCFGERRYSLVRRFIKMAGILQKSRNYLLFFTCCFLIAGVFIVYSIIASLQGYELANGIPILLANLYFYSFLITSIGKYFFVANRLTINKDIDGKFGKNMYASKGFKLMITALVLLIISTVAGKFMEVEIHELELIPQTNKQLDEQQFIEKVREKNDSTLFFIASHGGGLKANIWTLSVLNTLQTKVNSGLLDQTIALSGASGGSQGLALYSELYGKYGNDTTQIRHLINQIAEENFTSIDLAMVLGPDAYRKLRPLNRFGSKRDRPYYSMLKYQNIINQKESRVLSEKSFRFHWKEIFDAHGYFPSLVMNTAATDGRRGIFWSLKTTDFKSVFPYTENLADLNNGQTISYYQAVSTTNRFPIFSPAAKIKGYGHYIDAGAIDNSGLLGCLDVLNRFDKSYDLFDGKRVAIIEIINSKSLYIQYLMDIFLESTNTTHITLEENESSTIITDLKTGLNLDKIPGYLSGYLENWEKENPGRRFYFRLFMPHKVSLEDVETLFGGEFLGKHVAELKLFLEEKNNEIKSITEASPDFLTNYNYYEPALSRHLSESNIRYIKRILSHPYLVKAFEEIRELVDSE